MSPTVSFMRRIEPARLICFTRERLSSARTSSRPRGSARPSGIRSWPSRTSRMPLRMFCSVLAWMPGRPRSLPGPGELLELGRRW